MDSLRGARKAGKAPGRQDRINWAACEAPGKQERTYWTACEAPERHQGGRNATREAGKDPRGLGK